MSLESVLEQHHISRETLGSERLDTTSVDALSQLPVHAQQFTKVNASYGFVLEAAIRTNSPPLCEPDNIDSLLEVIVTELQDVNWFKSGSEHHHHYYYYLRVLREILLIKDDVLPSPNIIAALAIHSDAECPWGSVCDSEIVDKTMDKLNAVNLSHFIREKVTPACAQLSKLEKHTKKQYQQLSGSLRPHLGFGSGVGVTQNEESIRSQWYNSKNVAAISMIWFLIKYIKDDQEDMLETNWFIITSFILNLTDDTNVEFKLVSCRLLNEFLEVIGGDFLKKRGLIEPFIKSFTPNLSYIPSLTPVGDSLRLLPPSYTVICELIQYSSHSRRDFLELITSKVLFSINHVRGNNNKDASDVVVLLLEELRRLITDYVEQDILVLLSRINFVLSQLIIDPIEHDPRVIVAALLTQQAILQQFVNSDKEAELLVYDYRFDFMGAWTVLLKRKSASTKELLDIIKDTMDLLFQYANSLNQVETWHLELDTIKLHATQQLQEIISQQE
ncbi:uncharacterized protein KQ657_001414 [Scheffersomyces spartinae]|uniref:Uncharacterized protein n=1 Tax=Scheffersomyces spartinae TaxID=45513 RepID=A0A9P7V7D7_9ASCO|nr:uncharacterized protein KQ657_001414 [Scheffersomyces spartinae]KAG7192634.1 hypothetical protein KQ657_001414 [Scheffersomyces spartinae]